MVTGDEASIFPDQTEFQKRMSDIGRLNAATTIPGTSFMVIGGGVTVEQPMSGEDITRIFTEKTAYLQQYQADWAQWLADEMASWASPDTDIIATLKLWWEPLLAMSPSVRQGVGGNALIVAGDVNIYINFFDGIVEEHAGQTFAYKFTVPRNLLERVVSTRAVDWSNSLFLSCRFTAWREGAYNEYLYNFLKSLSVERNVVARIAMQTSACSARLKTTTWCAHCTDGSLILKLANVVTQPKRLFVCASATRKS
jgi:UDP-MurNAc hydroxylase